MERRLKPCGFEGERTGGASGRWDDTGGTPAPLFGRDDDGSSPLEITGAAGESAGMCGRFGSIPSRSYCPACVGTTRRRLGASLAPRLPLTKEMREVAARFGVAYPCGFHGTGTVEAEGGGANAPLTLVLSPKGRGNAKGASGDTEAVTRQRDPTEDEGRPALHRSAATPAGQRFNIVPTQMVMVVSDEGERRSGRGVQ